MSDATIIVGGETIEVTLASVAGPLLPSTEGNAGKFLVAGIDNTLSWASGTGADAGLREDLADPEAGASLVSAGIGSKNRPVRDRLLDQVSILDYFTPGVDDIADLPAAFVDAYADGRAVEIPAGCEITGIDTTCTVPDGKDLINMGILRGSGIDAVISMAGSGTFWGAGGLFDNLCLQALGGSPRIYHHTATGSDGPRAAILLTGTGAYEGVVIDTFDFSGTNFGILVEGNALSIDGLTIMNGQGRDMFGDYIELDRIWNTTGTILIRNHDIRRVNSFGATYVDGHANWGIGIGISGVAFDNDFASANVADNLILANITGESMIQLIHLECARRVGLYEIDGTDIDDEYSSDAGIGDYGIICAYNVKDVELDTVRYVRDPAKDNKGGISFFDGGTTTNRDLAFRGINLEDGNFFLQHGGGVTDFGGVSVKSGRTWINGRADELRLNAGCHFRRLAADILADGHKALEFDMNSGRTHDTAAASSTLILNPSITARDETGAISVTFTVPAAMRIDWPLVMARTVGDETTAITTGNAKLTFRAPHAMYIGAVRASLSVAQASHSVGGLLTVDVNDSGTSMISTKLIFDDTELTTATAATPYVISDHLLADDASITVDVDQIGDSGAKGLKVTWLGIRL